MFPLTITPFVGGFFWVFFGCFFAGCCLLHFIKAGNAIRNIFIIFVSLFVITFAQAENVRGLFLVCLGVMTFLVYYTGQYLIANKSKNRTVVCTAAICITILFLAYFKYSDIQVSFSSKIVFLVGVSYFSFKYIHFLVDCYKNSIKQSGLLSFLSYIFFFPSFFIGPINRYPSFFEDCQTAVPDIDLISGLKRIIEGLFKKIVLSSFFFPHSLAALDLHDPSVTKIQAFLAIYAYGLYVYFDFSGYTDMAIGCGRLVGIRLPENFNKPFFKRNLQQFWANWHMSLTNWLTDYIYWPLVRYYRKSKPFKGRMVTLSCVCIIITFMVCGIWHGDSINFFYWGLFHGLGLAILNVYKNIVKKYFTKDQKIFVNKAKAGYLISNMITVQYVCISFIFFAYTPSQMKDYLQIFTG